MKNLIKFIIIITSIILFMGGIYACEMPTNSGKFITLKGIKYNTSYDVYGQIINYNKDKNIYVFGSRLIQNKYYEVVYGNKTWLTCLKKVKSFPSLIDYCDNSFCGSFHYCSSFDYKKLKNYTFYIVPIEDINCKKHSWINYNKNNMLVGRY